MKVLYLGLDPGNYQTDSEIIHLPIIKIVPCPFNHPAIQQALKEFPSCTHVIITSKSTIPILLDYLKRLSLNNWNGKKILAVGKATAENLQKHGLKAEYIAENQTSEGLVEILKEISLKHAKVFWGHSALSRKVLTRFLEAEGVNYVDCVLYDTLPAVLEKIPSLDEFDEIIFTSPSTVDAFLTYYGDLPADKKLTGIGPITARYLSSRL